MRGQSVFSNDLCLHLFCDEVIHHDLPWNPGILEQRTGRIDRVYSLTERNRRLQNTVRQKSDIINKITLNISKMNEYNIPMKGILKK